jgi:sterol desaturase/sphingolipid hydroxylase (fatty acid hydroxylase superfamily)
MPVTGLSDPAAGVLCMVALDLVIYGQHALFHRVPLLWRLHRMHHTDLDVDVTTGARFHPAEILLSMLIKMSAVALLGAPAWSVVAFEVLLNATSLFNHSNVGLPAPVDRMLRLLLVTPDMHRVHHSVVIGETNSNFGFSLSWWDRIFGTYRREPSAGNEDMTLGLANYRDRKWLTLHWMLVSPFAGPIR